MPVVRESPASLYIPPTDGQPFSWLFIHHHAFPICYTKRTDDQSSHFHSHITMQVAPCWSVDTANILCSTQYFMCSRNKWGVSTTVAVRSSLTSSTMSVMTVCHTASRQHGGTKDLCAEGNLLHGGSGKNRYTAAQFNTNLHEINTIYTYIYIYIYIYIHTHTHTHTHL
jgi:hypothetical protein